MAAREAAAGKDAGTAAVMKKTGLSLSASAFYSLYRPSACEKRVFLTAREEVRAEPSELELLIRELGEQHEKDHLSTFTDVRNLGDGSLADRGQRTRDAVESGAAVIYQGVMRSALPGSRDVVTGVPDFMIRDGESYRIRDCKLSRSVRKGKHPEIAGQLQTYGWLFETTFGRSPAALEVYLGDGTVDVLTYEGSDPAVKGLERIRSLLLLPEEPWEPIGWSKCGTCPFQERCWDRAARDHDVSMIYGVDQATSRSLREKGISTYDQLLARMDGSSLAGMTRPRAGRQQRVGGAAARILAQARALAAGKMIRLGDLRLPEGPMVMFDLEGVPPQYDELDKVYLWGAQVYGEDGPLGPYCPILAGFGPDADRDGWRRFLEMAAQIMRDHGAIPFVHWAEYEKAKLRSYRDRFGDPDGIASRVLENCFDLLKAVRAAFALPVPSYGLKVVERLSGYKRTMEDYGGEWSIARYIKASRMEDVAERSLILKEIARYNEEDLRAMWAILVWARRLAA
jgi:predicted RecB family nuclease